MLQVYVNLNYCNKAKYSHENHHRVNKETFNKETFDIVMLIYNTLQRRIHILTVLILRKDSSSRPPRGAR